MTATQQRRPGGDSETAAVSVAAENSVPLALIDYTVRLALTDDTRLCLDDMPAGSHLVLDVTGCRFPDLYAVEEIVKAARRRVRVEIVAGSPSGARAWHAAVGRAGVRP